MRELNASGEPREVWEAVLRSAAESGKTREGGARDAALQLVNRADISRIQHAIRCYALWLFQGEVMPREMRCKRVKPVGAWQQLVLTLSVKEAVVKGVKLTLWDTCPCEGVDGMEEGMTEGYIRYETGLFAVFHHGIEEVCGWVSYAPEIRSSDLSCPSLMSWRHLEETTSPLWPAMRWLCLNLLAWQEESSVWYPEDLAQAKRKP